MDFPTSLLRHSKSVGAAGSYTISLCPLHKRRMMKMLKVLRAGLLTPMMAVKF